MSTIDEIRNSLGRYYLATNPGYAYVQYQQEKLAPALEALERREIRRLMINMPPGHAKSDWTTRRFVPWYMGRHPDHNAMVISYGADLASDEFGAKIKACIQSPIHLKIFPDSRLTQDSRGKTHFETIKGGVFYSTGFTGGITGKRLNLLVGDDWIKSFAEADSESVQDGLFNDYKGTIKDRMRPNGIVVLCAHRWREHDVYGRILEYEGTVEEGGKWTVLKLPAEDPPDSGNYLWEEYYGREYYEDFKKDGQTWWSKFQQHPSGYIQDRWFKDEWLRFHDEKFSPGVRKAYLICDPGATKNRKSDKTSAHLWLADESPNVILADWVHDKLDPGEREQKISKILRYWQPEIALYEETGMVSDTYYFNREAERTGLNAVLTPVGRKGPRHMFSKAQRIDGLKPRFREGRIILPRKFFYTDHSGESIDLTKRFLEKEYELYMGDGSVLHEDDLDCMSRLDDIEVEHGGPGFEWYDPQPVEREIPRRGHAGSWESRY